MRVVELAEQAVDQVKPSLLPLLLGVTASAYRTAPVPMLEEATMAIERGLELAHEGGDRLAEADLLRRLVQRQLESARARRDSLSYAR